MSRLVWSGRSRIRHGIARVEGGYKVILELWPDAKDRSTRRRFVSNQTYRRKEAAMEQYRTKVRPFVARLARRLEEGVPIDEAIPELGLDGRLRRTQ